MVNLRELTLDDVPAIQRVDSGASVRYTTRRAATLAEAHDKVHTALTRAAKEPRQQWTWGITVDDDLIGRIAMRRRDPGTASLSYILREDTWGNGYATQAVQYVARFAFTAVGLDTLDAKHHPDNLASGRVLEKAGFTRLRMQDGLIEYHLTRRTYAEEPAA
ncbi:GNAT family N-acetyltransferase [Streptomyces sp. NPDC047974]|uniref:GNAT family N-acetyltransferase n=1 Tax=Streptomyces sp. NPDC047974 TaxID=3154343 RepID=UPI0033D15ED1